MPTRTKPKVCAIIPCFNRCEYLRDSVDSVLAQSYPNIDLVVIDDGCTDESRKIMESYGDSLSILEHPNRENRGQSAGINLGIVTSSSEYIGILDSDDIWMPAKIEEQVEFLEAHLGAGLVYGNGYAIDEQGCQLYRIYDEQHRELSNPDRVLLDCYFLVPNNALVRRSVFERVGGFDESLRAAQDHDMAVRIAESTNLAYLNRSWFGYRRHGESISQQNAERRWHNGFRVLEKAVHRYPYSRRTIRGRRGVLHFRLGQCAFENGRWIRGVSHMLQAFANDPIRALSVLRRREPTGSPH